MLNSSSLTLNSDMDQDTQMLDFHVKVSKNRKFHNHILKTNPQHHEEEPHVYSNNTRIAYLLMYHLLAHAKQAK